MFRHPASNLFVPDGAEAGQALARTTVLGIGAHPDDLEFMALHGILSCFRREDAWFGGVTCTDGAGSARTGPYADCSDDGMVRIRAREQDTAAAIGGYSFMARLGHSSAVAKQADHRSVLVDDLEALLRAARPRTVYTHHGMDKHAAHVGVFLAVLEACRRLDPADRPETVYGCEVWRALDWVSDREKIVHRLDAHPNLAAALNGVFDSQITGGKRYDLAVEGRRRANATFGDPHAVDGCERAAYAIDLSPLFRDDARKPGEFFAGFIERMADEVRRTLEDCS